MRASLMLICARAAFSVWRTQHEFAMSGTENSSTVVLSGSCVANAAGGEKKHALHTVGSRCREASHLQHQCAKASSCCTLARRHHGRAPRAGTGVALSPLPSRVQSLDLADFGFYTPSNHWEDLLRTGLGCVPKTYLPYCATGCMASRRRAGHLATEPLAT